MRDEKDMTAQAVVKGRNNVWGFGSIRPYKQQCGEECQECGMNGDLETS